MILDALFVIWITWQVAPKGRPGGGCWERGREIIPRDSIYACLNVFDCALLIQIKLNSDSTSGCLHCCCFVVVLLLFCFPAVSWASAQKELPYPISQLVLVAASCWWCWWWWCNFSLITIHLLFVPRNLTYAFCGLWKGEGEGHQFQWQLAPVGINKVSAGRVSPPPGEFVIKQIGRTALKREGERDEEGKRGLATFIEFRVFFAVKIAANVALIITNDFIYHISYVLC